ncbi:MAG: class I SAM-dependent methyltransferase [Actinomycetia bacterium]|nr:class I SAM-dependent methyltransferase [Actinomycetes bacterium]
MSAQQHTYLLGHDTRTVACLEVRESGHEAAFLLPHLKPGLRLLDCGCGPGTISVGLAKAVAPGEMVGLDTEMPQVQAAAARATELGIANAVFEVGDLTDLRYDDETFDVVFAHAVVMLLPEPAAGLAEMSRVTKPEGIVAIRDPISDASICAQENPLFHEGFKLFARAVAEAGGDVSRGRDPGRCCRRPVSRGSSSPSASSSRALPTIACASTAPGPVCGMAPRSPRRW